MKTNTVVDFFLGSHSPQGFRGYFDALDAQPDLWLYLIKAGPGCGKSTMMKRLASAADGITERIHCSSDPDSLDGVIFSSPRAAVLDATAPHTLDPAFPGAKESVVSLYHTLDAKQLRACAGQIRALFGQCGCHQAAAGRSIVSAGMLLTEQRAIAARCVDSEKLRGYATRLAARCFPRTGRTGREQIRLLSAVTPQGVLVWRDTVSALCDQITVFQDEYGAAAFPLLAILRQAALDSGYEVYSCVCPLSAGSEVQHLLVPERGMAFVTSNRWHPMEYPGQKTVRCSRFWDANRLRCHKNRLLLCRKTVDGLLEQASASLRQAKACHDVLERYYVDAADFAAVDKVCAGLAAELGLA